VWFGWAMVSGGQRKAPRRGAGATAGLGLLGGAKFRALPAKETAVLQGRWEATSFGPLTVNGRFVRYHSAGDQKLQLVLAPDGRIALGDWRAQVETDGTFPGSICWTCEDDGTGSHPPIYWVRSSTPASRVTTGSRGRPPAAAAGGHCGSAFSSIAQSTAPAPTSVWDAAVPARTAPPTRAPPIRASLAAWPLSAQRHWLQPCSSGHKPRTLKPCGQATRAATKSFVPMVWVLAGLCAPCLVWAVCPPALNVVSGCGLQGPRASLEAELVMCAMLKAKTLPVVDLPCSSVVMPTTAASLRAARAPTRSAWRALSCHTAGGQDAVALEPLRPTLRRRGTSPTPRSGPLDPSGEGRHGGQLHGRQPTSNQPGRLVL